MRWPFDKIEEARAELCKYKNTYIYHAAGSCYDVEEYALEYCITDDNDFIQGSDFELAEEGV